MTSSGAASRMLQKGALWVQGCIDKSADLTLRRSPVLLTICALFIYRLGSASIGEPSSIVLVLGLLVWTNARDVKVPGSGNKHQVASNNILPAPSASSHIRSFDVRYASSQKQNSLETASRILRGLFTAASAARNRVRKGMGSFLQGPLRKMNPSRDTASGSGIGFFRRRTRGSQNASWRPSMQRIVSGQNLQQLSQSADAANDTTDSSVAGSSAVSRRRRGDSSASGGGARADDACDDAPLVPHTGHLAVDCIQNTDIVDSSDISYIDKVIPRHHLLQFGSLLGESSAELALSQSGIPSALAAAMLPKEEATSSDAPNLLGSTDNPGLTRQPWEQLVVESNASKGLHYWAWRRYLRKGLFMYKSRTVFEGVTATQLAAFYFDSQYKLSWDDSCTAITPIPPATSPVQPGDMEAWRQQQFGRSCHMYARSKFPAPMAQREYQYARRVWAKADDGGCYVLSRAHTHASPPAAGCRTVKVEDFQSGTVIRDSAFSSNGGPCAEMVTVYFEDSHVSSSFVNIGIKKALWPVTQKFEAAMRKFLTTQQGVAAVDATKSHFASVIHVGDGMDTMNDGIGHVGLHYVMSSDTIKTSPGPGSHISSSSSDSDLVHLHSQKPANLSCPSFSLSDLNTDDLMSPYQGTPTPKPVGARGPAGKVSAGASRFGVPSPVGGKRESANASQMSSSVTASPFANQKPSSPAASRQQQLASGGRLTTCTSWSRLTNWCNACRQVLSTRSMLSMASYTGGSSKQSGATLAVLLAVRQRTWVLLQQIAVVLQALLCLLVEKFGLEGRLFTLRERAQRRADALTSHPVQFHDEEEPRWRQVGRLPRKWGRRVGARMALTAVRVLSIPLAHRVLNQRSVSILSRANSTSGASIAGSTVAVNAGRSGRAGGGTVPRDSEVRVMDWLDPVYTPDYLLGQHADYLQQHVALHQLHERSARTRPGNAGSWQRDRPGGGSVGNKDGMSRDSLSTPASLAVSPVSTPVRARGSGLAVVDGVSLVTPRDLAGPSAIAIARAAMRNGTGPQLGGILGPQARPPKPRRF